jgi:mlo protein
MWLVCFFQQFHIPKADYVTLRQTFITTHHLRDDYDFDAYMVRCMESEFEKIVGISAKLWAFVILFLLFNVHGVYLYFWSSFIPLIVVLVIGAKLQVVVVTLALEAVDVPGSVVPQVLKPRNELFWFGRPGLLLNVLHLVLFQNAFELATFLWQLWTFGWDTCVLEENKIMVYARLAVGLIAQLFCSFITLPLYTLVSQMGTNYKEEVLPPTVGKALRTWHKDAKKRVKLGTLFSFGGKKNKYSSQEEEALRDSNSGISTDPPMGIIMEEVSLERDDRGQVIARSPRSQNNVYIQIDPNGQGNLDRKS